MSNNSNDIIIHPEKTTYKSNSPYLCSLLCVKGICFDKNQKKFCGDYVKYTLKPIFFVCPLNFYLKFVNSDQ